MFGLELPALGVILGGARRWLNKEAMAAVAVAVVAVAVLTAVALMFSAVSGGATAKADRKWLTSLREFSVRNAKAQAEMAARTATAADEARVKAEAEREAALVTVADLEQEIARLKALGGADADPIVFPKSLARSLRK